MALVEKMYREGNVGNMLYRDCTQTNCYNNIVMLYNNILINNIIIIKAIREILYWVFCNLTAVQRGGGVFEIIFQANIT